MSKWMTHDYRVNSPFDVWGQSGKVFVYRLVNLSS